jgi:ABC transporter substrate binding protein (PQQ-dependent alcohol dehydrogenase system)
MRGLAALLSVLLLAGAASAEELRVGYLALDPDPRYDETFAYARIPLRPGGDTTAAAEMALADMAILTDARDYEVVLDAERPADFDGLAAAARRMVAAGARHIVLDLPGEEVDALAQALEGAGVTLLNATAPDDWLRRRCYPHLLHTAASDRMISDALVQHLVLSKWDRVLVLRGKTERDATRADSFSASAARFRLDIVDSRTFDLSTNPALREENNLKLLTAATGDYDVTFVADEVGEYSRYVPYRTTLPRPVMGATGLTALEWHWSLERYGAPQVNSRFESASEGGRRMTWQDWSVWVATRAVLTAHAKSRDRSPEGIDAFLRSDDLRLDGSKGAPMSFRPWSGQLRMPILLATHNAIIGIAPLEGFLHQTNTLDSLGADEPEFQCE